jgi:hypothetical protein
MITTSVTVFGPQTERGTSRVDRVEERDTPERPGRTPLNPGPTPTVREQTVPEMAPRVLLDWYAAP